MRTVYGGDGTQREKKKKKRKKKKKEKNKSLGRTKLFDKAELQGRDLCPSPMLAKWSHEPGSEDPGFAGCEMWWLGRHARPNDMLLCMKLFAACMDRHNMGRKLEGNKDKKLGRKNHVGEAPSDTV